MLEIQRPRGSYGAFTGTTFPQDNIGVMGWDDGVPIGTGTVVDFRNNISAVLSGTVLTIDATPPSVTFPQDNIGVAIQDEGKFLVTGVTIDIMGAVAVSGSVVNLRVPKTVSFVTSAIVAGGLVFTNLAAADTTYIGVMTDLTGYTQCKLGGVFGAASLASASGAIIHIMWQTGSSYASLNELSLNPTTEQGRLRWIASTQAATDWFTINPGAAYKDVGLHVKITGGNGTADPNLLGLFAEFR